jgi:hypothetical protein
VADRTYDNATTFEEMMAWHREDRPSCPSDVVVMAGVGYGCEACGWSVEEASLRLKDQSHPQPCDHWSPHPKDGFCVACGWAQVVHDIGSPSDHFRNGRASERAISGLSQEELWRPRSTKVVTADDGEPLIVVQDDWAESTERLDAFMAEHDRIVAENERLRAECERHRRANLVRSVLEGWDEEVDGALTDYINEHGWDAVPWKVAEAALSGSREAPDA